MSAVSDRDRTKEFFHGYAGGFNSIYSNKNTPINTLINTLFRKSMRLRFEKTLAGCDPIQGKTVLDIGCGPGHYSVELARRGAERVVGVDFAEGMIAIAQQQAEAAGVTDRCEFSVRDFHTFPADQPFDYTIVMGFMDYVADAVDLVEKVLRLTRGKAFFSFPRSGGLLAWQRQLRYKSRCELYLYSRDKVESIFANFPEVRTTIEPIARDFFVTATMPERA
ncbi:MAG: methyltransferase domain-containing protein [Isosphaeraceae bacterium]|nr:methyltransferase domain-containing protein [Isosphaeraceae bacterium]